MRILKIALEYIKKLFKCDLNLKQTETIRVYRKMTSQNKSKWMERINEIKTLFNVALEKLDALSDDIKNFDNNLSRQPSGLNNEPQLRAQSTKIEPAQQQTQETDQESEDLLENHNSEQFSDVVSEKGPITSFKWGENDSQTSETPETLESGNESGSVYEPSQLSERTQSQSIDEVNKKEKLLDWQKQCLKIVNTLWKCEYSKEFRNPVDPINYPDYEKIILHPMDLSTVREQLDGGNYKNLKEFQKDMSLIFENSKKFTPDKKSKIYKNTNKMEKKYEKLIDAIVCKNKKSSPTKRKANVIESDIDSDAIPLQKPKRRKRIIVHDEAGTSNDSGVVGSRKKKMCRTSPRKKPQFTSPSKRQREEPNYKEESTDSSTYESETDDTLSTSNSESTNYEEDSDCSFIDLSENEKERREEIAKTIPLSDGKIVDMMNSNSLVTLTGRVVRKWSKELFSKERQKDLELFAFLIQIGDGKKINCRAWEDQASKYRRIIRTNQIICIEKGKVQRESLYNEGDIDYEILIAGYTKITDKIMDKRLGED